MIIILGTGLWGQRPSDFGWLEPKAFRWWSWGQKLGSSYTDIACRVKEFYKRCNSC